MTNKVILRNIHVFWIAFSFTKMCLNFSLNRLFEFGPTPIHDCVLTDGRADMRKGEVSRSFMTRQICSLSAFESFLLHRWAKSRLKRNIQPSVSVWLRIHKRSLCQKAEKHHTHAHTIFKFNQCRIFSESITVTDEAWSVSCSLWQPYWRDTNKWNSGSKSTPILIPQSTNTKKKTCSHNYCPFWNVNIIFSIIGGTWDFILIC